MTIRVVILSWRLSYLPVLIPLINVTVRGVIRCLSYVMILEPLVRRVPATDSFR